MPSLDSLPGDQRAVLQLVLGKGRGYADIARLLSLDPGAVRARALTAARALAPPTSAPPERVELIVDYLLGQLDPTAVELARSVLADSPGDRAWARMLSTSLAPLAPAGLPDVPTTPASAGAAVSAAQAAGQTPAPPQAAAPQRPPPPPSPAEAAPPQAPSPAPASAPHPSPTPAPDQPPEHGAGPATPQPEPELQGGRSRRQRGGEKSRNGSPRTSRIGGAVLIGLVIAAAVILILRANNNSSSPPAHASSSTTSSVAQAGSGSASSTTTATSSTPTTSGSPSSTTTTSSTTAAKVLAQINLTPPASAHSNAAGIAEILKEGSSNGLAVVAQNVAPNTTHPPNAYAVWLYNSPTDAHNLGFVNPGVGKSGRFSTATTLPANASHYHQLLVTVETSATPKVPGKVILRGALSGL